MAVCAAVTVANGRSWGAPPTSLDLLRAALGTAIQYTAEPVPSVRYCPDNTCDVFEAGKGHTAEVEDFALVYLWYVSEFYPLSAWRKGPAPARLHSVVEEHSVSCPPSGETSRAKCALLDLAKVGAIQLSFVRYDEGAENKVPLQLSEELKRLQ